MFIDELNLTIKAGKGGDGKASFFPGYKSGPNGGSGGDGGDVFLSATSDLTALNQFVGKNSIAAENGGDGRVNRKTGKDGRDLTMVVPLGTILTDSQAHETFTIDDVNQKILLCKGGKGGKGTYELRSPSNTTPLQAEKGKPGQLRNTHIVLKLIAHFGLIGLPNAGKSSLLNMLTAAHVKVANYPFTTLEPNLGVMNGKIIADIPGLIEGASLGKGLGIKFLKHAEKVSLFLHCVSSDSNDIEKDYLQVRNELEKFSPELLQKNEIILLTKSDLLSSEELKTKISKLKKLGTVISVSIYQPESVKVLQKKLN